MARFSTACSFTNLRSSDMCRFIRTLGFAVSEASAGDIRTMDGTASITWGTDPECQGASEGFGCWLVNGTPVHGVVALRRNLRMARISARYAAQGLTARGRA